MLIGQIFIVSSSSSPSSKRFIVMALNVPRLQQQPVLRTLEAILDDIFSLMIPGDQILFSPAGASFDVYENYAHRGDVFKELVRAGMKAIE